MSWDLVIMGNPFLYIICGDNSVQVIIHMIGCAELGADYSFAGSEYVVVDDT